MGGEDSKFEESINAQPSRNRRLTSLWHARRNKSMINRSIKEEECKSNKSSNLDWKREIDERMRKQSIKMRQGLEQRKRIRSHDT